MKKMIVANWKMNKNLNDAVSASSKIKKLCADEDYADVVLCPPFTSLHAVSKELHASKIKLGAQNMHFEDEGAFTGDVSPLMLKDAGCEYVILGHSERREFFFEDDDLINKKLLSALRHSITPILCIGERLEERQNNKTKEVLERQLTKCLRGVTPSQMKGVVIAYEPVWAISRGNPNQKAATANDATDAHAFIREVIKKKFGGKISSGTRLLYGGSMKPENAKELLSAKGIDGGLVGNASLNAESFAKIVEAAR